MSRLIKITAVVIGDRVIKHNISIPNSEMNVQKVATEFLKRSYSKEFSKIVDIKAEQA